MELIQSKSVLARLMAAENINVQHGNVPTAYFDLANRTLMLPQWKDMDGYMYDLLCGHEVGHALDTPSEGWHHNVKTNPALKSFLNVIEDARIEKRIKRKFPGLAASFAKAYRELYERDFFGIKKIEDLNQLNLIDRINLHFKLGMHVIVPFTDEEREFVRETANAEKWEEVVDIATRVHAYVKSNESDKVNNIQDLEQAIKDAIGQDEDGEDGDDGEESSQEDSESMPGSGEYEESDEESDGEGADSDSDSGEESDEESDGDAGNGDDEEEETAGSSTGSSAGKSSEEESEEPHSVTDDIFRQREAELVSDGLGKTVMIEMSKPDLDVCIVPVSKILAKFEAEASRWNYSAMTQKALANFNSRNKKYIALLVKEFEMRKNATEYARAQISRSGQLDTSKLFQYRTKNDLFRRVTTIGKGKSHGMQMVFDMSGSMSNIFRDTVDQILVLATFCRRVNIPFEVYGFSDDHSFVHMNQTIVNERTRVWNLDPAGKVPAIALDPCFRLVKFISSDMSASTYRRAFNMLAAVADQYTVNSRYFGNTCMDWEAAGFRLGGTPLTETHVAMRYLAENFKKKTNVDHVNVIIMTDGEGGRTSCWNAAISYRNDTVYVVDPISKLRKKVVDHYDFRNTIVELTHDVLAQQGIKMIGYYIAAKMAHLSAPGISSPEMIEARKQVKKNGFYMSTNILGFDSYYLMTIGEYRPDTMQGVDANSTKSQLKNAFKQMNLNKRANRGLASNFAKSIAL